MVSWNQRSLLRDYRRSSGPSLNPTQFPSSRYQNILWEPAYNMSDTSNHIHINQLISTSIKLQYAKVFVTG